MVYANDIKGKLRESHRLPMGLYFNLALASGGSGYRGLSSFPGAFGPALGCGAYR